MIVKEEVAWIHWLIVVLFLSLLIVTDVYILMCRCCQLQQRHITQRAQVSLSDRNDWRADGCSPGYRFINAQCQPSLFKWGQKIRNDTKGRAVQATRRWLETQRVHMICLILSPESYHWITCQPKVIIAPCSRYKEKLFLILRTWSSIQWVWC